MNKAIRRLYITKDQNNVDSYVVEFDDNTFVTIPNTPENKIHIDSLDRKLEEQVNELVASSNGELSKNEAINLLHNDLYYNLDKNDERAMAFLNESLLNKTEFVIENNELTAKNVTVYKDNVVAAKKNGRLKAALTGLVIGGLLVSGFNLWRNRAPQTNVDQPSITVQAENGLEEFANFLEGEELGLTEDAKVLANGAFASAYLNGNVNESLTFTDKDGNVIRHGFTTKQAILNSIKINQKGFSPEDVASLIGQDNYTLDEIAVLATENSKDWAIFFADMFAQGKIFGDPSLQFLDENEKLAFQSGLLDHIGTKDQDKMIKRFLDKQILEGTNTALTIVAFEQILPAYMATHPGAISDKQYEDYAKLAETVCADMSIFTKAAVEKSENIDLYKAKAGLEIISVKGDQILVNYDKHEINWFNKETATYESFDFEHLLQSSKAFASIYEVVPEFKATQSKGSSSSQSFKGTDQKAAIKQQETSNKKEAEKIVKEKTEYYQKIEDEKAQKELDRQKEEKKKGEDKKDVIYDTAPPKDEYFADKKEDLTPEREEADKDYHAGGSGYVEGSKEENQDNLKPTEPGLVDPFNPDGSLKKGVESTPEAPKQETPSAEKVEKPVETPKVENEEIIEAPEIYDPSKEVQGEAGSVVIEESKDVITVEYEDYYTEITPEEETKGGRTR